MAILKCKMCGGDIQIHSDQTYGTCDSCGSTMTLPKASDERATNLFNRANHFRRLNDFDKALSMYENILNEDNTNAEAHWGVVLSKYGIEYVEDPKTHKRIPTCNRMQFSSILSDVDYLAALDNAEDAYTRSLYEEEALQISKIQKRILSVSNNVEPFDVFICYKEKTNGGSRTKDSVLAQDIYFQLTKLGYKVFFARITLEEKLGIEYEPYIFAALNSAKVMTVIGTKEQHFNAVWVKNEWSRFLALMKKDTSKLLIPCFKDMNPYDLPDELSMLQSQDMSKIGFIQDLIRGIKKVLDDVVDDADNQQPSHGSKTGSYESLLERGFICLEDSLFPKADSLFEQVLNINPKCARAYIGKLLAERKLCKEDDLLRVENSVENSTKFKRALMYADDAYKQKLLNMKDDICERLEEERKQAIYDSAIEYWQQAGQHADSNQDLYIELMQKAIQYFNGVKGFKDSDERIKYLTSFVHEVKYQSATKLKKSKDIKSCEKAMALFSETSDYKDSQYQIIECQRMINEIKYNEALEYKNKGTAASLMHAASIFAKISDFNDADVQRKQCEQLAKEAAKREQEQKRKAKKVKFVVFSIVAVVLAAIIMLAVNLTKNSKYNDAISMKDSGQYPHSIRAFNNLGDYKDSSDQLVETVDQYINSLQEAEDYEAALEFLDSIGFNKTGRLEISFLYANALRKSGEYSKAMEFLDNIKGNEIVDNQKLEAKYQFAKMYMDERDYPKALYILQKLGTYEDCPSLIDSIHEASKIVSFYAGYDDIAVIRADGCVDLIGDYITTDLQEAAKQITDVSQVAVGNKHIVGLKEDGTVVAAGNNEYGQCDVDSWENIVQISVGSNHTVGLKSDGTVVATGYNEKEIGYQYRNGLGACEVDEWRYIVEVHASANKTFALKMDGTIIGAGITDEFDVKVGGFGGVVTMDANMSYSGMVVGIKSDGTLAYNWGDVSKLSYGGDKELKDFESVVCGSSHVIAVKTDGSIVAIGTEKYFGGYWEDSVEHWDGIVDIQCSTSSTFGLKQDGTIITSDGETIGEIIPEAWQK